MCVPRSFFLRRIRLHNYTAVGTLLYDCLGSAAPRGSGKSVLGSLFGPVMEPKLHWDFQLCKPETSPLTPKTTPLQGLSEYHKWARVPGVSPHRVGQRANEFGMGGYLGVAASASFQAFRGRGVRQEWYVVQRGKDAKYQCLANIVVI